MRRAVLSIPCALLISVLGWSRAHAAPRSEGVEVRIYADYVNFRDAIPHTFPQRELVKRHFQRIETLLAHYQRLGPSPAGKLVPWYFVTNRASGESGWVISTYVQPIETGDAEKLSALPFEETPPHGASLETMERDFHLNLVGFLVTLLGLLLTIYGIGLRRGSKTMRPQTASAANVLQFPAPSAEPDVVFGMADNQVWVHRSRRQVS